MTSTNSKFANVNSAKRASGTPEDLVFYLDHILQQVTKVELLHFSCYNTFYNVTMQNNVFKFTDANGTFTVAIDPGCYTSAGVINVIKNSMNAYSNSRYQLSYNAATMKLTISSPTAFSLNFSVANSMAGVLGFAQAVYSAAIMHTSPNVMNLGQPRQILCTSRRLSPSSLEPRMHSSPQPLLSTLMGTERPSLISMLAAIIELPNLANIGSLTIQLMTPSFVASSSQP